MSRGWGVPDPLDVPVATEPVQRAGSKRRLFKVNDGCLLPMHTAHKDTDVFL